MAILTALSAIGSPASAEPNSFSVTRYANGNANVYLVETARHVVLIDCEFWVGHARAGQFLGPNSVRSRTLPCPPGTGSIL